MSKVVEYVLLDASIKGPVLLAAAGLLTLAMRRSSAAARHLVWSLAIAGCLGLPVLAAALPDWQGPPPRPLAGESAAGRCPASPPGAGLPGGVAQRDQSPTRFPHPPHRGKFATGRFDSFPGSGSRRDGAGNGERCPGSSPSDLVAGGVAGRSHVDRV